MELAGKQNEAALYYLCMAADGNIAKEELELFDRLCGEMQLTAEDKRAVIDQVESWLEDASAIEVIREQKLADTLWEEARAGGGFLAVMLFVSGNTSKRSRKLARYVWNLVLLSYADGKFSGNESAIISYLLGAWKLDLELYREFVHAADTVRMLMGQQEWVKQHLDYNEAKRKLDLLDEEIAWVGKSVQTSISEI